MGDIRDRVLLALRWRPRRVTAAPASATGPAADSAAGPLPVQLDGGTYKAAVSYDAGPDGGILPIEMRGSRAGTFDTFVGTETFGVIAEITGLDVGAKGGSAGIGGPVTKNASSSGFRVPGTVMFVPMPVPFSPNEVAARLASAQLRLEELLALKPSAGSTSGLAGADPQVRLRLAQEFFFHLIGAIEVVAQIVNERLALRMDIERTSIRGVFERMKQVGVSGPMITALAIVAQQTLGTAVPSDPYSDEALVYRALISRHHVTHRHRNPFVFDAGDKPAARLLVDVRRPASGNASEREAGAELQEMLRLVREACEKAIAAL